MNAFPEMSQGKYFPVVWPIQHITDETNLVVLLNELHNKWIEGDIHVVDTNAMSECHLSSNRL